MKENEHKIKISQNSKAKCYMKASDETKTKKNKKKKLGTLKLVKTLKLQSF